MRSKLTKTIFTIVFVVFLGLVRVDGVDAYQPISCVYENDIASITVEVDGNWQSAHAVFIADYQYNTSSARGDWGPIQIDNWNHASVSGANTYDNLIEDLETLLSDRIDAILDDAGWLGDVLEFIGLDDLVESLLDLALGLVQEGIDALSNVDYGDADTYFSGGNNSNYRGMYLGYEDLWANMKCPSYIVLSNLDFGIHITIPSIYFFGVKLTPTIPIDLVTSARYSVLNVSDTANLEKIRGWFNNEFENAVLDVTRNVAIPLVASMGIHGNEDEEVSRRECQCDNTSNVNKKIHADFVLGDNNYLSSPDVSVNIGNRDREFSNVENWNLNTNSTQYTGQRDYLSNDKCPDYLLYKETSWLDSVYFSDELNLNIIKNDISNGADVYVAACEEKVYETPPETPVYEKPEYHNPSVNSNVVKPLEKNDGTVSCGNGYMTDIPSGVVNITKIIYILIQIIVPIALVLLGTLDLTKAITSQKEDEIKKGQQVFVKRLIAAVIVFFVFALVKLIVGIASNNDAKIIDCMNCFLNGGESCEE